MKIKLFSILFFILCLFNKSILYAQSNKCKIRFKTDTSSIFKLKTIVISLTQNGHLTKCRPDDMVLVDKGVNFAIEFESPEFIIPGIKNIKVYTDTLFIIAPKNMEPVIINSKKRVVQQTLKGFEYSPANDSIFKNQSLLLSMQRLPFMILQEEDEIKYIGGRVLYKINGREKKGITGNWNSILRAIKAKDIYKVEMQTEVPAYIKNQGYDVIINILTLDANLYGKTFSAAVIFNTRNTIMPSLSFTQQHKKADFSLNISSNNDVQSTSLQSKVLEDDHLIYESKISTKYKYYAYTANLGYGLRIDSAHDIGISVSLHRYENNQNFITDYSYPAPVINQRNILYNLGGTINVSYIHRKNKFITKSLSANGNIESQDFNNRFSFMQPKNTDSINHQSQTRPSYWILEYNYLDTKNETYNIEYGIQAYKKDFSQSYYHYSINNITNENLNILYSKEDSLLLNQYAVRPYFKYDKDFSPKKNFILNVNTEYYSIKNKNLERKYYLLPGINISYKTLYKNNTSLKYSLGFSFSKPSEDYFTGILYYNNPTETRHGATNLTPGKSINGGVEYTIVKKASLSQNLSGWYSFDEPGFFTLYDSIQKIQVTSPNNGESGFGIYYSFYFQKLIGKKLNISFFSSISYLDRKNNINHSSSHGILYRIQPNFSYFINSKFGSLGFWGIIEGNRVTSQGSYNGPLRYSFFYAKTLFKRKIAITFIADEFLKRNRLTQSSKNYDNIKQFTNNLRPNRMLSIRIAYNFSNIRLSKFAQKKSTYIKGEKSAL